MHYTTPHTLFLNPKMNILIFLCSFLPLAVSFRPPLIYSDQDYIRAVIDKQPSKELYRFKQPIVESLKEKVPKSFDARHKWPMCESLNKVRNHRMCGAGWAFAAVSTMSDRLCIHTNGKVNIEFSPQNLVSCCEKCGGCNIGNATEAWAFWVSSGIVSGGDYDGSFEGCQPYTYISDRFGEVPTCEKHCQSGYKSTYVSDKFFGASFYVIHGGAEHIQLEILKHGPVQAGLEVYEDFFTHKKGVYRRGKNSKYLGYTYVRLLGWGRERNTPFWLGATSWGTNFGILNGYFKILRGKNEAGIEGNVVAGLARVNRSETFVPLTKSGALMRRVCDIIFTLLLLVFLIE